MDELSSLFESLKLGATLSDNQLLQEWCCRIRVNVKRLQVHVDYRKVGNPSQDFVDQLSKKIQFAFTSQGATLPELRVFILKRKSKNHRKFRG